MSQELEAAIEEALAALSRGEVVGIPTETVYGVAVDPFVPGATERLFRAKRRPDSVALPVLVAEPTEAERLGVLDGRAARLASRFWPGPLTVVLRRQEGLGLLLGGDETTIGLRCPDQPVARRLLERSGPLAVTSANLHGEPPLRTASSLIEVLGGQVAVVVDAGRCEGVPSTVVSLLAEEPEVLRPGALSLEQITAALGS